MARVQEPLGTHSLKFPTKPRKCAWRLIHIPNENRDCWSYATGLTCVSLPSLRDLVDTWNATRGDPKACSNVVRLGAYRIGGACLQLLAVEAWFTLLITLMTIV